MRKSRFPAYFSGHCYKNLFGENLQLIQVFEKKKAIYNSFAI